LLPLPDRLNGRQPCRLGGPFRHDRSATGD
jgi:hypothetical protein